MNSRVVPSLRVRLAGAPLTGELAATVAGIHVLQQLNAPSHCQLELMAPPPAALAMAALGAALEVFTAAGEPLFAGELEAIERHYRADGNLAVTLRGYDALQQLRRRRHLRQREVVSWRQLAAALAGGLGLEVVDQVEDFPLPASYQWGQSDFDLLVAAAHAGGRYFHQRGARLEAFAVAGVPSPVTLHWRRNLFELSLELNRQPSVDSVTVSGWNFAELEPIGDSEAELPLTGRVLHDRAEAERRARAEHDWRAASAVSAVGVAAGDSRLRPGAAVALAGLETAPATLVLARVSHRLDRSRGYICEFDTALPAPLAPGLPHVTIGLVCEVADPARRGRVRVSYPTFGAQQSGWLSVMSPGGGRDKGFTYTPEVGDRTLVLLPDGGLGQGVILGGLTAEGHPDPGVDGDAVRRSSWHSRGGHRIRLDDGAKRLELRAASGSYLRLDGGGSQLHSSRDLLIDAPGRAIVIRAARVDFEHAP